MFTPDIPLPMLAAVTTTFVLLLVAMWASMRVTRRAVRTFRCPLRGETVTAEFEEEDWDDERVAVMSCSAFAPSTAVACEKGCLGTGALRREPLTAEAL